MDTGYRILWADDEVDLLQPHLLYLEQRGYRVTAVQSGEDALHLAASEPFDLILLDERMPGLDGMQVLERLRALRIDLPVIMVTKQEDEELMEEAHGRSVADFLTKPVNPSQVLSACKRILEGRILRGRTLTRDYTQEFARLRARLSAAPLSPAEWGDLAEALAGWAVQLDETGEEGLSDSLASLHQEADGVLARQVTEAYPRWVADTRPWPERLLETVLESAGPDLPVPSSDRPVLVSDLMRTCVLPQLHGSGKVLLLVLDCLRYDQWLALEQVLGEGIRTERVPVFSLLPTATPFSRNALLGARYPDEVAATFPDLWREGWEESGAGLNRHEQEMVEEVLQAGGGTLAAFDRVYSPGDAEATVRRLGEDLSDGLSVVVVNFLDVLAHGQAESEILQELAPDPGAFRALARGWFERSPLLDLVRRTVRRGVPVLIATDHGSTQVRRPVEVTADRTASRGLRYKTGRNLQAEPRRVFRTEDTAAWRLPALGVTGSWLMALEDAFLVFRNDPGPYRKRFSGSFQHGGVTLSELIVPLVRLTAR